MGSHELIKALIIDKQKIAKDTFRFTCRVKEERFFQGLMFGMHSKIKVFNRNDQKEKMKSYSIVHDGEETVSFIIKVYNPCE